uniref:Crumbs cell polarity complex component 1 n=1 Tax=Callorhinchus milii TaxID=7868 RepID=A0A4W3K6J7_CALMI
NVQHSCAVHSVWLDCNSVCCAADLNKCLPSPCKNNAICEEHTEDYVCHCPATPVAFTGKNCEEPYDSCSSDPCLHNATCKSTLGTTDFSCNCLPGYTGNKCEIYINECAHSPCRNEATCLDDNVGHICLCTPGYTGRNCETDMIKCASSPCANGAVCKDKADGFSCFCVPGFQGKQCEIEVDECASEPCMNGAMCMNKIDKYICKCPLGFTGTNCELDINECFSQPCLNAGTCHDNLATYSCTCALGFKGSNCEINLDECESQPCQNGGRCIDEVNRYSCDCADTQFTGLHCEIYVPACLSQPCLNNATCQDTVGYYTCHCWPGFTGTQCEIDINECHSNPCVHGGECLELSWQNMYGNSSEIPAEFSYEHAVGYICRCQHGFTGSFCEMDVNECDQSPCQNGGTCQNTAGSYICQCPTTHQQGDFYGGKNCTDLLIGCENHKCQNRAKCIPSLKDAQHVYHCICAHGYTGLNCQTQTTFSFDINGYLHVKVPASRNIDEPMESLFSVSLRFRTLLLNTIVFHRGNKDTFMRMDILNGYLYTSLQMDNQLVTDLQIFKNVSDGDWHTVEMTVGRAFAVKLLDDPCSEDCTIQKFVQLENDQLASAFESIFFGGATDIVQSQPYFVGCLQDVEVDSKIIVPEKLSSDSTMNMKPGCRKKDWCQNNPCQNRGKCLDLWLNYKCECFRPYVGSNCSKELIPGRFGHEDTKGYALFIIDDDLGEEVNISMFIRTRKRNGLLFALKNSSAQYLQIRLDSGKIIVQSYLSKALSGDHYTSDSDLHFITVNIGRNRMKLTQSGQMVSHMHIHPIKVQAGDLAYIGGLPDQLKSTSDSSYFKGCIQDLRINNKSFEFYPNGVLMESYSNRTLVNVTSGCIGDNTCKLNPCLNGGLCASIWDDFVCTCPPNTSGKMCDQVKWCQLGPCPSNSQCHLLSDGFDCISNATFKGEKSMLTFRGNGKIVRDLINITFSLRTRNSNAILLHAEKEHDFITIGIKQCHLIFMMQSGNSLDTLSMLSLTGVSDGLWHNVILYMTDPLLHSSRWQMEIDKQEATVTSTVTNGNMNFLAEGTDIYLGGGGPEIRGSLAGCLNTVKLGGISLPYFESADIHINKPQQEQFIKISSNTVLIGCPRSNICASNPCRNNGRCEDMVGYYQCNCLSGWTGLNCEVNINECQSNPCVHGNCTDKVSAYKCICAPGFTGTRCETNRNDCHNHKCANGARCIDGINGYSCSCPTNFIGRFCEYPRLSTTLCIDEKKNWTWTCYNGGNCTDKKNVRCNCPLGFSGSRCEMDADECQSDPCLNGGLCQNLPGRFQCICDMSFVGDRCEVDVILAIILFVLILKLRDKRQTEGTYSPSNQEQTGSRMEMNSTLKLPPEERLI